MALIDLKGIRKSFHLAGEELEILHGIDLEVESGEFLAMMGPSGSGKSTTMNILGCLDVATQGTYHLQGRDVTRLPPEELARIRNREIGFVFQGFNLLSKTSALENVSLPLLYAGVPHSQRLRRAAETLERMGLGDRLHHNSNQLSGGQQQRVAIARALVNQAPLLLADEPTGNLDSKTSDEIMALFQSLNRQDGITIVLVTHEPDVAAYADRRLTFRDGQIHSDSGRQGATKGGAAP